MTVTENRNLQRELNSFTKRYKLGFTPLRVDGTMGRLTRKRLKFAKYLLGYERDNINSHRGQEVLWRLNHPRKSGGPFKVMAAGVKRGKKRRNHRRANVAKNHLAALFKPGVGYFDGKPVARPLIPDLKWARAHGWRGKLVSGFRTPPYSESLCYAMCGHPSCPGRCAGRSSRHSQITRELAAIDVSFYDDFGRLMNQAPYQPRLRNLLGYRDPVHFSVAGN